MITSITTAVISFKGDKHEFNESRFKLDIVGYGDDRCTVRIDYYYFYKT